MADADGSDHGMEPCLRAERTLYRFFVVWQDGDEQVDEGCCPDVESTQTALSTTEATLVCLSCGESRVVEVEIAEIVV